LQLDKNPQLKANVIAIKQLLTRIREKLYHDMQLVLINIRETYNSEQFQELIAYYPNHNIELNQEDILQFFMDSLTEQIIAHVDVSSKVKKESWNESLSNAAYLSKRDELAEILKEQLKIYDWLNENLAKIKVPYSQGVDHHRNQGEGTCLVNSIRRHEQLVKNSNVAIEHLGMGSDEKGRKTQARINLSLHFTNTIKEELKVMKEHGVDTDNWSNRQSLSDFSSADYKKLVDKLIPRSEGKPLLAMLCFENEDRAHVVNIQVDRKSNKFRILDDNIGAMEFSSQQELKKQLASYLKIFYSDYKTFYLL
jgi:hypothetical protein